MKEGVLIAANDIIVFLDGDIDPYPEETIRLLSDPLLTGKADFVKSTFSRNAGRDTELMAKPLLSIFFPELLRFSQPLSGMIAARKEILLQLQFREDYGVDIGILIDMKLMNVRTRKVKIGNIENKSKPWQELGKMSREVAQAIIEKVEIAKNLKYSIDEHELINAQMDFTFDTK